MSRPLPRRQDIDAYARTVHERLLLAAARGDAQLALEAARKYEECGLSIRICAYDFAPEIHEARIIDASQPDPPKVYADADDMSDLAGALLRQLRLR